MLNAPDSLASDGYPNKASSDEKLMKMGTAIRK